MTIYDTRTASDILTEMLANARDDIDKRQGSVAYDMLAPVAQEIELLGFELEAVYMQGFLDTAVGEALGYHAQELGLERKEAVAANGVANITGTSGTIIPIGYRFLSASGASFVSTSQVTITNGIADVPVSAVVPGEIGNLGIGELIDHERNVVGITSVTNNVIFTGGVDAEDDDSLRERALFKARKPITSGNANHYQLWATEVEGVASAKIFPTFDGPNTVKVVLIADGGGAPSQSVVDAAYAYIETQRPIGAKVTVTAIEEVRIAVSAKLVLDGDLTPSDVSDAIAQSINAYLLSDAASGVIRINRVGDSLLHVPGVLDYEYITINDETANVLLTAEQVAVTGELTLT